MNFNKIKPKKQPYKLIRLGGRGDGAYILPDDLDDIEACFSPGVSNSKAFEDDLTNTFQIKCHMCDFSSDIENFATPLIINKQTFEKKWLNIDNNNESISLKEWIFKYTKDSKKDLILQMDIEEAEYPNLINCSDEILKRFRIIILEVHEVLKYLNDDIGPYNFESLMEKLLINHDVVHVHGNNVSFAFIDKASKMNIPNVMEITFLRKDRFKFKKNHKFFKPLFPNQIDIKTNVPTKPILILNKYWNENLDLKSNIIRILIKNKLLLLTRIQINIYYFLKNKNNLFLKKILIKIYHFINII